MSEKTYDVKVKYSTLEKHRVKANSKEEAEELVMEGGGNLISTDDEIYSPEVINVKESS